MKRNNWFFRLAALLMVSAALCTLTVLAVPGDVGSQDDPLVSLSYLQSVFLPEMLAKVDERVDERAAEANEQLRAQVNADIAALEEKYAAAGETTGGASGTVDSFVVVTMTSGQVLYGEIGCEVMLRVGSASCVSPGSPGLIDETSASTLENGKALVKNHLYMFTIVNRSVKATAATTKLLVRGTYTIQ